MDRLLSLRMSTRLRSRYVSLEATKFWTFFAEFRMNFDCHGPWDLFEAKWLSFRYIYAAIFVLRS